MDVVVGTALIVPGPHRLPLAAATIAVKVWRRRIGSPAACEWPACAAESCCPGARPPRIPLSVS